MLQVRRDIRQHRETAAHMKAADANRNACGAERPRNVNGARKLIGLNADQADECATAAGADLPNDLLGTNSRIRFIPRGNLDLDVIAQRATFRTVERQSVDRRKRVGRDRGARPLDDIALVIIVRRLDEEQTE